MDGKLGCQTCQSTDATNSKSDVSDRVGDEGEDEQSSVPGLTKDRQTIDDDRPVSIDELVATVSAQRRKSAWEGNVC